MRRVLFAVLPLGALLLGCPAQQEICRMGVDQVCERVFECTPEAEQAAPQFQAAFGTSVENCKELLYQNPLRPQGAQGIACAEADTDQELCLNLGRPELTNFDLAKSQECRDIRAELSCQDYLNQLQNPAEAPEVCLERCAQ